MTIVWVVTGLLAAGFLGWPVTYGVLRLARAVEQPRPAPEPNAILRGGLAIGVLERLAVAAAVLADEPVAIAYVVAVKGLGRYAELKETPAAAERFIIGTLASMLWAVAVAVPIRLYLL
ncbi:MULTISPECIES: hypothetical protein [unclassified Arthrobacter]|uniref:hypothetical protein n=1 Tax=unclassified Arthrobacter TaxID=235627 RepID=UPI001E3BCE11|nr:MULTISPECIES: hypothetical protein [unclassified Arthrobacter]MCC9146253.1 hypothetical protein [Arthrobacter sp. zg-Y919]MDK1277483.1 hypothetical protein [Arthrobacter sp. zg.Y919]MDM7990378.1 hypothetical protein [Arthrobacter sp. zg-Y877]WIB03973.1 hypothetical protein QNO10_04725 [Arthrobacter sp. zg-Y919]